MATVAIEKTCSPPEFGIEEKLVLIDNELVSFFEFCKRMGFTNKDMDDICSPLRIGEKPSSYIYRLILTAVTILFLTFAVYQSTCVTFHIAALGRMALVKTLPLWDWRTAFHDPCLIENIFFKRLAANEETCLACEDISEIHVFNNADYDTVVESQLNRNAPFIVVDAMDGWPVMQNSGFSLYNITELYQQVDELDYSIPCTMKTNLRLETDELHSLLKLINNPAVSQWFAHWRNCDTNAMKALRLLYKKPYFLPKTSPPAHYNWVFLSSNYGSENMKMVDLDTGLIMLNQLRGSTVFQLLPISACKTTCPELSSILNQGEILVFKNDLWNFQYRPGLEMDNVAILLETAWESSI